MKQALEYLFEIYFKFITFIFDKMEFFDGVTFGWVMVSIFVFGVLIKSLLSVPSKGQNFKIKKEEKNG